MKYINIVLSVFCLLFVCVFGSADTGGIGSLWDGLSLMLVLFPSYLLTAGAFNSYNFFSDKKSVLLFGDLALGFGIIGTCLGIIFMLAGMAMPPPPGQDPVANMIINIAISTIALLYGLLIKYFVSLPLAHSIKVK